MEGIYETNATSLSNHSLNEVQVLMELSNDTSSFFKDALSFMKASLKKINWLQLTETVFLTKSPLTYGGLLYRSARK